MAAPGPREPVRPVRVSLRSGVPGGGTKPSDRLRRDILEGVESVGSCRVEIAEPARHQADLDAALPALASLVADEDLDLRVSWRLAFFPPWKTAAALQRAGVLDLEMEPAGFRVPWGEPFLAAVAFVRSCVSSGIAVTWSWLHGAGTEGVGRHALDADAVAALHHLPPLRLERVPGRPVPAWSGLFDTWSREHPSCGLVQRRGPGFVRILRTVGGVARREVVLEGLQARIYQEIEEPCTVADLAGRLAVRAEVDELREFLSALAGLGLAVEGPSGTWVALACRSLHGRHPQLAAAVRSALEVDPAFGAEEGAGA